MKKILLTIALMLASVALIANGGATPTPSPFVLSMCDPYAGCPPAPPKAPEPVPPFKPHWPCQAGVCPDAVPSL